MFRMSEQTERPFAPHPNPAGSVTQRAVNPVEEEHEWNA